MRAEIPFISVIVPVFEQWHFVPALMERLDRQVLPASRFELLLVDNGSSRIPEVAWTAYSTRVLCCRKPGSYAARNHGASAARGDILAFTDADCLPSCEWLSKLQSCLKGSDDLVVAGGIAIAPRNADAPAAAELYDILLGIPQALYVRRGYGVTANLAVSKDMFDRLGGFDSWRYSGGDAEFCRRAGRAGVELVYCAEALVEHPARETLEELATKVRRIKGGQIAAGPFLRRFVYASRAFMPPVRAWRRTLGSKDFTVKQRLTVCRIQARLWLVEMAEVFRLIGGARPERR
jgi:glycosyltransferase involved in cell wall biosynthesis